MSNIKVIGLVTKKELLKLVKKWLKETPDEILIKEINKIKGKVKTQSGGGV